jgi:Tfp pilus assembly protein PilV
MNMRINTTKSGFTLIETIVALGILMTGALGPLLLVKENLSASRDAKDRLIASFLAQEGIEMVRSVVSNSLADDEAWLINIAAGPGDPCRAPARSCIVDVTQPPTFVGRANTFRVCSPQNGANVCQNNGTVYQNATSFLYRQSDPAPGAGWNATKFSRWIDVDEVEVGKRAVVTVTVMWDNKSVVLSEEIYRWFFQLN